MNRIFQAETGTQVEVFLSPNASITALKQLLAQSTGIPPENQILLEREGTIAETIKEDIFMFDRTSFTRNEGPAHEQWIDFETQGFFTTQKLTCIR
jgi:uncharacterized protein YdeI (BOF family)